MQDGIFKKWLFNTHKHSSIKNKWGLKKLSCMNVSTMPGTQYFILVMLYMSLKFSCFAHQNIFFMILFIYSWEIQRARQRHRQREKQAPCRKPDEDLIPGSWDHDLSQGRCSTNEPPSFPMPTKIYFFNNKLGP